MVLNETTNPFNAKLVYYDGPTGTKAYYACFDAKVVNKMLDYMTSQRFIGENWYYKALASAILLGNYIEGTVVLSTSNFIPDSMRSTIQNLLWSQAKYWLPTDSIKVNKQSCTA